MEKSSSSPALMVAGAAMSHVPKRATQHGIFLAGYEVQCTTLKPGQDKVDRHVYGEEFKSNEQTYLGCDMPAGSVYQRQTSELLIPQDYWNPTKPMIPSAATDSGGVQSAAHWGSTYKSGHSMAAIHGAVPSRQHGPSYQAMNPPTCLGRGGVTSSYNDEMGRKGEDPRDKMTYAKPHATMSGSQKMPVFKGPLTYGSAKGTQHMPGYSGFLATNTNNPYVARVENGADLRSVDKSNLTQQFHTNLVGYMGHVAKNPNNDKGGVSMSRLTSSGRDFNPDILKAFASG